MTFYVLFIFGLTLYGLGLNAYIAGEFAWFRLELDDYVLMQGDVILGENQTIDEPVQVIVVDVFVAHHQLSEHALSAIAVIAYA